MTSYGDEQIADAERRRKFQESNRAAYGLPDSGRRAEFDSGMVRDVEDDKVKYDLALDGPMFERWATHMTAGAEKYEERNWMKAEGIAEFDRFRRSALRHFIQWFQGNDTEDHAAAVFFNINGAEYVTDRMVEKVKGQPVVIVEQEQESPTCDTMDESVNSDGGSYLTPGPGQPSAWGPEDGGWTEPVKARAAMLNSEWFDRPA